MRLFARRPTPVRLLLDAQASQRVMARIGTAIAWEQARRRRARRMTWIRGTACMLLPLLMFAVAWWLWR